MPRKNNALYKRKLYKSLVVVVIFFSIIMNYINIKADNNLPLYSMSAVLMDGESGRVLYGKNMEEERAMASTTKIMTLIIALEFGNLDEIATVSSYASKMPDVQLGIKEGEQYRLEDLIYSMMLESHNDSAVAIAEHVGGSVEQFANMMNDKARDLGLTHTYFITPNGLDAEDSNGSHHTTAKELAKIMRYCVIESPMKDEFMKICQTKSYSFSDYDGKRSFTVNNHNKLLDMYNNVLAGKTGFTADAGYCYVCAVELEGKTYIVALLGCGWPNNKNYKWSDTKALLNYGQDNYVNKCIFNSETYNMENEPNVVLVYDGREYHEVTVSISEDVEINALLEPNDKVDIQINCPTNIKGGIMKGDIIGQLDIYINDVWFDCVSLRADETIWEISMKKDLSYCFGRFMFE